MCGCTPCCQTRCQWESWLFSSLLPSGMASTYGNCGKTVSTWFTRRPVNLIPNYILKMKKLLTLIVLMAFVMSASAKSVVFTLKDGTLVYYFLGGDVKPVMRFVEGKVTVNTDTYEFSDIKNFYISAEDDPNITNIENLFAQEEKQFSGNVFVLKTATAKPVKVYDANGAMVEAEVNQADGYISVDMNSLRRGTYIIKVGEGSFKVLKK